MVNVGLSWSSFLGIALAVAGASLYFLRSMRPKLARDHDIFFAAVGLLCGGILFFQGWRQDPILQFGQFLLTGTTIFFAVESIRLRGVATEQAKRNSPIVDDDRPVSPVYRYQAEFEELNPYDERTTPRRIRGTKEARPTRDEYEEGGARRRPSSSRPDDRPAPGERPRRRPRPRPEEEPTDYSETPEDVDNVQENKTARSPRSGSRSPSRSPNQSPGSTRSRRPRPTGEASEQKPRNNRPSDAEPPSSEYVDYRPVDKDEEDNWGEY